MRYFIDLYLFIDLTLPGNVSYPGSVRYTTFWFVFLGDIIFSKQEDSSLSAEWLTAQRENQGPLRLS